LHTHGNGGKIRQGTLV